MLLVNATVWWNGSDSQAFHPDRPQIKILDNHARDKAQFDYLENI